MENIQGFKLFGFYVCKYDLCGIDRQQIFQILDRKENKVLIDVNGYRNYKQIYVEDGQECVVVEKWFGMILKAGDKASLEDRSR